MCSECTSTKTHNGLCDNCASKLQQEYDQSKEAMKNFIWIDSRRFQIVKAKLADYDNPRELPYQEREIAKLLNDNYQPGLWR